MYQKIIDKLKDKKIAILGFKNEGISTYNFIRRHSKMHLTILDKRNVIEDNLYLKEDSNTDWIVGDNYLGNIRDYDYIIKTPGIPLLDMDDDLFPKITSQLELILEIMRDNIIGITGTKGKSTTTSLLYEVIKNQKENTFMLGNIGIPIFDHIEQFNKDSTLVIEMSSHQLEFVEQSPHIGAVLNLYQDHLDHTGTLEKYHNDKMHIFKYQNENDYGIYDGQNKYLIDLVKKNDYKTNLLTFKENDNNSNIYLKDNKIYYKENLIYDGKDTKYLIGNHNLKNIMVVILISEILKLDINKTLDVISNFKPLQHRLEKVCTHNDITYYNDTIATIPEATIEGIKALGKVNTLIFGGMDRNIDYKDFISFLDDSNIKNYIGLKETGHNLCKILEKNGKNVYYVDTMKDAVDIASKVTKKNYICLLSPAAASYNQFKNFEEKGNCYKYLVKRLDKNKAKVLIFDMDGTLWDTTEGTYKASQDICNKYPEIGSINKKTVELGMGLSDIENARLYMPNLDEEKALKYLEEIITLSRYYISKNDVKIYDGVEKTIKNLYQKYDLAIVTNNHNEYAELFLNKSNLNKYFKYYIGAASYEINKKDAIKRIMNNYSNEKACYIGDIKKDMEAAQDANVEFIHAKYGFGKDLNTKYEIDDIKELESLLEKENI